MTRAREGVASQSDRNCMRALLGAENAEFLCLEWLNLLIAFRGEVVNGLMRLG